MTEVIVSVLVEYEIDELEVVMTTGSVLVVLSAVVVGVGVCEVVVVVVVVDEVVLGAKNDSASVLYLQMAVKKSNGFGGHISGER